MQEPVRMLAHPGSNESTPHRVAARFRFPIRHSRFPALQISTCEPSSTSRLPGMWKKPVAGAALR
ncbi:MAG: hypothetical protein ACR2J7_07355, partial [Luteimonas sp.]